MTEPAFKPGDRVELIPQPATVTEVRWTGRNWLVVIEMDNPGFDTKRRACGERAIRKLGEG